jgi:hypothetical protein
MRLRRGNYMIMFSMILPLLLGFLAFTIDLGRLRVARIQAQNAADAAVISALADLRAGGSIGSAEGAAQAAANAVRLKRLTEVSSGRDFLLDVAAGEYSFKGDAWTSRPTSSAVQVNVTTNEPLGLLFAPVFGGRGFGFGRQVFQTGDENAFQAKDIAVGRRGAFRPRDLIVAVDTSRAMGTKLPDVRDALRDFMDTLRDFGVPEERVALVEFAGAARQRMPLTPLRDGYADLIEAARDLRLCHVGVDAWFHFYRYFDPSWDLELYGEIPHPYNALGLPLPGDDTMYTGWEVDAEPAINYRELFGDIGPDEAQWVFPITTVQACALTYGSYMYFRECDPRRVETPGDCEVMEMSDLDCHEGNYWDDRDDRWEFDFALPELDCAGAGVEYVNPYGDIEAYGDAGDGVDGTEAPDRSYVQAGTHPGAGLIEALAMLDASAPRRAEPTVLLVSASGPRCGELIDPADAPTCVDDWLDEAYGALLALEERHNANTHVIGLVDDGSISELLLSTFVTGRGFYQGSRDVRDLPGLLDAVARDIKLQIVD